MQTAPVALTAARIFQPRRFELTGVYNVYRNSDTASGYSLEAQEKLTDERRDLVRYRESSTAKTYEIANASQSKIWKVFNFKVLAVAVKRGPARMVGVRSCLACRFQSAWLYSSEKQLLVRGR